MPSEPARKRATQSICRPQTGSPDANAPRLDSLSRRPPRAASPRCPGARPSGTCGPPPAGARPSGTCSPPRASALPSGTAVGLHSRVRVAGALAGRGPRACPRPLCGACGRTACALRASPATQLARLARRRPDGPGCGRAPPPRRTCAGERAAREQVRARGPPRREPGGVCLVACAWSGGVPSECASAWASWDHEGVRVYVVTRVCRVAGLRGTSLLARLHDGVASVSARACRLG